MKKETFERFDAADYLKTKEDVLAFLDAALEENDIEFFISAIGDAARSKGMAQLSKDLDLDRKGLYKAFSHKGNPAFLTVVRVLDNMGFCLKMERKSA